MKEIFHNIAMAVSNSNLDLNAKYRQSSAYTVLFNKVF